MLRTIFAFLFFSCLAMRLLVCCFFFPFTVLVDLGDQVSSGVVILSRESDRRGCFHVMSVMVVRLSMRVMGSVVVWKIRAERRGAEDLACVREFNASLETSTLASAHHLSFVY